MELFFILYKEIPKSSIQRGKERKKMGKKEEKEKGENLAPPPSSTLLEATLGL